MWNPFSQIGSWAPTWHFGFRATPCTPRDSWWAMSGRLYDYQANKKRVKVQYDKSVCPQLYVEGDLVLLYDQAKEPLGAGKFNPMWHGPYIMWHVLEKGAYELEDSERNKLVEPRNGLYLKRYYTWAIGLGRTVSSISFERPLPRVWSYFTPSVPTGTSFRTTIWFYYILSYS